MPLTLEYLPVDDLPVDERNPNAWPTRVAPMDLSRVDAERVRRFHQRVDTSGGPDACWLWMGTINSSGYGHLSVRPLTVLAHRLAHYLATGEQPENVCHTCDTPPCCNPSHLFSGTRADNQHDKGRKGRAARGMRNAGGGKLSDDDVRAIRVLLADGETQTAIGQRFGVSRTQIGYIARGRQWSHV